MSEPKSLFEFKEQIILNLKRNLDVDYDDRSNSLKVQMVESNTVEIPTIEGFSSWKKFDDVNNWFVSSNGDGKTVVVEKVNERVWAVFSIMKVDYFKKMMKTWLRNNLYLDNCWLSYHSFNKVKKEMNWDERGIGIRYNNAFSDEVNPSNFSIKAWYGLDSSINEILDLARDKFSVSSMRLRSYDGDLTQSEWYTNGRITFNASDDIDSILYSINHISDDYYKMLEDATKRRNADHSFFEFNFKKEIDLKKYEENVKKGKTNLQLWMVKTEDNGDFIRFQGVDTHTWDRILLDLGQDYAYMTIPGKGCVNAAPRLVTIQGEEVSGKTTVFYDGDEVFV